MTIDLHPSRLSVAPMMDWTDRHCRMFHRQMTRHALLYTEMVTSAALVRGGADHLLDHDPGETPVAVQLGGADPGELAEATAMSADAGFAEVNLNIGCPSDRVQSGCFGAILMERPALVADCVRAMAAASPAEVTVKCRIGVDDQTPQDVLPDFLARMQDAGVRRVAVHARKAWLKGLSPKQNREVPPLDHALVVRMAQQFPGLAISINGGIATLDQAQGFLATELSGVMIGRAAYHTPAEVLLDVDSAIFGDDHATPARFDIADAMRPHIAAHLDRGGRLHSVTRHMLGLFHGQPGARSWRQVLSTGTTAPNAGLEVLDQALERVAQAQASLSEAEQSKDMNAA
jgi:tRNA-dihydrouridine synthase A